MSGFTTLSHEVQDGILVVTLNRSEHLNAFTFEMADERAGAHVR
ncbi:hypothetical protein ACFQH9_04460 [Pseudonocardia lutea]|uniref:Enoyl-CoA hydratase n=1 Tax=Pseudonocardia lutea TaxID=2172015 RepID=A0ABW1I1C6_9PSEU